MVQGRQSFLNNIPPAVRILIILNVVMFLLTQLFQYLQIVDLNQALALYFFKSELFKPYQIITHMFMHGNIWHLVFNMYALWLFGQIIEQVWGPKKFLIYYFITGLGAAIIHSAVIYFQLHSMESAMTSVSYNIMLNSSVIGASGAIFGILLAFGMLFPNAPLQFLFIPVPIKAKYIVIGYGLVELSMGINNAQWDNVAHFAHLGGMIFGFILIKIWGKGKPKSNNFYQQY